MKKFYLALIIFLILPVVAFAQTRQELAVSLAKVFDLKGEISGLYYYNDWQKIDKVSRVAVSQCALTGLYEPERGEYLPLNIVGTSERKQVAEGLDKFIFLSNKYDKLMGIVNEVDGDIKIELDNGGTIETSKSTAFLDSRGLATCENLRVGQKVNLCIDNANKVYIVWEQKTVSYIGDIESYEVAGVRQGELYLWDLYENEFIFKMASRLRFGAWQAMGGRYDNLYVHDGARVFLGNDEITRADINKKWLDKRVNYIIGKNMSDGSLRILHLEFE